MFTSLLLFMLLAESIMHHGNLMKNSNETS